MLIDPASLKSSRWIISSNKNPLNVLVACEYSGTVRDAFIKNGHNAISCDFLPTDVPGPHYQGNVFDIADNGFDLIIAHPPCTYMCNSSAGHLYINKDFKNGKDENRWNLLKEATEFFNKLWALDIEKICMENPIMLGHARSLLDTKLCPQIIQPWMFGAGESKATCLWLKKLPKLKPTHVVSGRVQRLHSLPPSEDRWKIRSKTYQGIADAMADQWGGIANVR